MKISKEEIARRSGMAYAYKICLDNGYDVPALQQEIIYRNITNAPLSLSQEYIKDFCHKTKLDCVATFRLMTILTLHDEFGFEKEECERFMKRFMLKIDCLNDDLATWSDYQQIMMDECKIKVNLSDEFLNMKGNNID